MSKRQSVIASPSGLSPQIPLRKLSEPGECTGKRMRDGESPTMDINNFSPFSHGTQTKRGSMSERGLVNCSRTMSAQPFATVEENVVTKTYGE